MAFDNLFNKVAGSVRNVLNNIARGLENSTFRDMPGSSGPSTSSTSAPQQPPPPSSGTQNIYFYTQTTGLKYTAAQAVAGIMVNLDTTVSHALSEAIGQAGVQRFQEALRPLRRTGDLENSFQYQIVNNGKGVIVFSDHPSAASIQYGYTAGGTIASLQDWMQQKAEFRGLSDKEQRRAAYFIIKKIRDHHPPGGASTLKTLAPVGERRYDYLTVVREALEKDVQELLDGYTQGLT